MQGSIRYALLVFLACVFVQPAQAGESDIVDGFTEFLVDRANANLVAVFERRLKDDDNFKCYFPNTSRKIEEIRLADLFASRSYWESSLIQDLRTLKGRAEFLGMQAVLEVSSRNNFVEETREAAIRMLQLLDYKPGETTYHLNLIESAWPDKIKQQVNGFSDGLADALNRLGSQSVVKDPCELAASNEEQYRQLLETYEAVGKDLAKWAYHVEKYGKHLRLPKAKQRQAYCWVNDIDDAACATVEIVKIPSVLDILSKDNAEEFELIIRIGELVGETSYLRDIPVALRQSDRDTLDRVVSLLPLLQSSDFTIERIAAYQKELNDLKDLSEQKMKQALAQIVAKLKQEIASIEASDDVDYEAIAGLLRGLIYNERPYTDQALSALDLVNEVGNFGDVEMERLRHSVMFFVAIVDAEDKDAVKSILKAYTLPAVSYAEKRKLGDGFFISAYLGLGLADTDVHGSDEDPSDGGLFAPVGIEYNLGTAAGDSWSFMLSPIDMAYPVNLKLRGIEEDVNFDELIAPSVTVAYGLRDYPVNVGIGYQKGRKLDDVDESEEKWLLFVTFDMPLLRLY